MLLETITPSFYAVATATDALVGYVVPAHTLHSVCVYKFKSFKVDLFYH